MQDVMRGYRSSSAVSWLIVATNRSWSDGPPPPAGGRFNWRDFSSSSTVGVQFLIGFFRSNVRSVIAPPVPVQALNTLVRSDRQYRDRAAATPQAP